MLCQLSKIVSLAVLSIAGAGCCCVPGLPGGCGPGMCGTGNCGSGPLMGLASCRGACGEVYVDEWISEPPVVDHCGPNCGGCQSCYQPVRNLLRMLWGTPYVTSCNTRLCGPSCESGCDSWSGEGEMLARGYASSGHPAGCDCGGSMSEPVHVHAERGMARPLPGSSMHGTPVPAPDPAMPAGPISAPPEPQVSPEAVPPTSSAVSPSSATRRLNPALSRRR